VYLDRLASEVSVSEVTTYYVGILIFISLEHFVTLSTFKQFKNRYNKYYRRLESGVSHHLHNHLLGRPTLVGKALSFTDELSFVFFYQFTVLSSQAVDGHQMYFGGSVVGKASTIGREISPTYPLIFTGGQKVQNLASLSTSLNFEPLAFENAASYPNAETNFLCMNDCSISSPSLVKLGPRTPENRLSVMPHP